MVVELVAQVAHDVLADHDRQITVAERGGGAADRGRERVDRIPRDYAQVVPEQPLIDDGAQVKRRQQPQRRGDEHGQYGPDKLGLIGNEGADDPFCRSWMERLSLAVGPWTTHHAYAHRFGLRRARPSSSQIRGCAVRFSFSQRHWLSTVLTATALRSPGRRSPPDRTSGSYSGWPGPPRP